MSQPDFTVDVYQNEFIPEGGRAVNAVVTVTSADTAAASATADAGSVEIIIVDCSGSMSAPREPRSPGLVRLRRRPWT